jgi:hypothetical protein
MSYLRRRGRKATPGNCRQDRDSVVVGDAVTHTRKKREEGESKKEWMTAYQPNERQEEGYSRAEEKRRTPGESNKQTLAGKTRYQATHRDYSSKN